MTLVSTVCSIRVLARGAGRIGSTGCYRRRRVDKLGIAAQGGAGQHLWEDIRAAMENEEAGGAPLMEDLAYIQSLVASHSDLRDDSDSTEDSDEKSSSSDSTDTDSDSSGEEEGRSVEVTDAPPVGGGDDTGGNMQAVEDCLASMVTHVARAAEGLGDLSESRCAAYSSIPTATAGISPAPRRMWARRSVTVTTTTTAARRPQNGQVLAPYWTLLMRKTAAAAAGQPRAAPTCPFVL